MGSEPGNIEEPTVLPSKAAIGSGIERKDGFEEIMKRQKPIDSIERVPHPRDASCKGLDWKTGRWRAMKEG
jgi:hypothetical protein